MSAVLEARLLTLVYSIQDSFGPEGFLHWHVGLLFGTALSNLDLKSQTSGRLLSLIGLLESNGINLVHLVEIVLSDHGGCKHEEHQLSIQAS